MRRKIYLHIGLPKTATSSLQADLFPSICKDQGWSYAGVQQPRRTGNGQESIYTAFVEGMHSGNPSRFTDLVTDAEREDAPIILSEEMVLVGDEQRSWTQNINNVRQMVSVFDYQILITIREPVGASFSYYVQRYDYFKRRYKQYGQEMLNGPEMQIYHYDKFIAYIQNLFGEQRVKIATFERFTNGDFAEIEDFLGIKLVGGILMGQRNTKKQHSKVIFLDVGSNAYGLFSGLMSPKFRQSFLYRLSRPIRRAVQPALRLIRWNRTVSKLSEKQKVRWSRYFKDSLKVHEVHAKCVEVEDSLKTRNSNACS